MNRENASGNGAFGNPESLVPELLVFGSFCVFNLLELFIVPSVFLNYCLISTVETFVNEQEKDEADGRTIVAPSNSATTQ